MAGLYDGPVIDAHHHLWRYAAETYPWLAGPGLQSLRRDVDGASYRQAAGALDVRETVWVEALASDPLAEAVEAQRIHAGDPRLATAIVAHVPLRAPDVEARIRALRDAVPNLRGIRDIGPARPGGLALVADDAPFASPAFVDGIDAVARHDLVFDLLCEAGQLEAAARVFARLPQVQVVIEHAGSPDLSTDAGVAQWQRGLAAMARLPNVAIKVSALQCRQPHWTDERLAGPIETVIDLFGASRVAFASDFPVHDRTCPFERAYLTFRRAVRHRPASVQQQLFHDTAARLYRLGQPCPSQPTQPADDLRA